jgi:rhodanese-related sulfurtransferase
VVTSSSIKPRLTGRQPYTAAGCSGARNIPVDELRERQSELKNKNVLVNCQVGLRGHTGSMLLKELGFNAVNLDGGYLTWINSPAGIK